MNKYDDLNSTEKILEWDRYQLVINELGAAVFEWNFKTGKYYCSDSCKIYELCNQDPNKVLHNEGSMDVVHPDDVDIAMSFFKASDEGNFKVEVELRLKLTDGTYHWCRVIGLYKKDDDGIPERTIGIIIDVNDTMEDNHKKDELLNKIPVGIGVFEIKNGVAYQKYMNDWFFDMLGKNKKTSKDVEETKFWDMIYYEDQKNVVDSIKEICDGKNSSMTFARINRDDDSIKWIRMISSVVRRDENSILVYTSYQDMTYEIDAKKDLVKSNSVLRSAVDSAKMGVWEYDPQDNSIVQTESNIHLSGYSKDKIFDVPESMINAGYVKEEFISEYRDFFERFKASKSMVSAVFQVKNQENDNYWWEKAILTPLFDDKGNLIKGIGTSINITEQKQTEQRFKQQIDEMNELNAENLLAKGRYNLTENKIQYYLCNREKIIDMEYKEFEKILITLAKSIISESDKTTIFNKFSKKSLMNGYNQGIYSESFIFRRKTPEGKVIWCETKCKLSQETVTDNVIAFVYSYDITERKKNEQIINKIREMDYDALGLIDVNTGCFTIENISEKINKPKSPIKGNYDEQLIRQIRIETFIGEQGEVARNLVLENVINQLKKKDKFIYQYFTCNGDDIRRKQIQFCYLDDSYSYILFSRTDVTDDYRQEQLQLQQTEKALAQAKKANEEKTQFFSNMSHDMRTPMNGILGLASLMKNKDNIDDIRNDLDQILLSGRYLLNLINDTLDMNQIESGKLFLNLKPIDSKKLFENVIATAKMMAQDKGVNLVIDIPIKDNYRWIAVLADAPRVEQIFMNVISNAVKYTYEGGTVTLSMETIEVGATHLRDRYVIKDNGIGMSEEFIPHMFETFTQEGRYNTKHTSGSGLGMSIVKKLVNLMNGDIVVKSKIDVGTEVIIEIPYEINTEPFENDSTAKELDKNLLSGKKILLCEDNELNSEIAYEILHSMGLEVVVAEDGLKGLNIFKDSKPGSFDAILMDIRMPVMDGLEATRHIRELPNQDAKNIPIIALTANAFKEDVDNCINAGMNEHLSKPFEVSKIYQTLVKYILGVPKC